MEHPETPEAVALELLRIVVRAEGTALDLLTEQTIPARAGNLSVRQYILQVYAECLVVASGKRLVSGTNGQN